MNPYKRFLLLLCFPFFSGCIALAVGAGGLGVGYTWTNIAHKTINHPVKEVNQATVKALKNLEIQVVDNGETGSGSKIKAATIDLDIEIELEYITSKSTRISVNAKEGILEKDKATALEIISQTEKILAG